MTRAEHAPLPYASVLVVLPPSGEVRLSVTRIRETYRTLRTPLVASSSAREPLWVLPDPPEAGVTFQEIGRFRGVRLGRLEFTPVSYEYGRNRVRQLHSVEVVLEFEVPLPPSAGVVDPFHEALSPLVLNPQVLVGYPRLTTDRVLVEESTAGAAQFEIHDRAVYALPWSLLESASVVTPADNPARVRLERPATGAEVALHWDSPGRRFLFYADPQPTRWAPYEVYRAVYGSAPGLRMGSYVAGDGALPSGTAWSESLAEEQVSYDSLYPSLRNGDHWYWRCLERPASAVCPTSAEFPLKLDAPEVTGPAATLTIWLHAYTTASAAPNHRVSVTLNDVTVGEVVWSGRTGYKASLTVPAGLLHTGENTVRLSLPGLPGVFAEGAWVDALVLRYPLLGASGVDISFTGQGEPARYDVAGLAPDGLVFDVTNPDVPVRLPPGVSVREDRPGLHDYYAVRSDAISVLGSWAPRATMAEPAGADYLVLAPRDLIPALASLLEFHTARGLTTFAAPVEAVYDIYGDGRMAPEALRAFVAHAYHTWEPQPRYLLLIGDGTWDPLDHLGTGSPTLLPPYLAYVDPWIGEVPADNRYVTVDGADNLPDLAVGRLPVNSVAELNGVLDKIVAYATSPYPGDWKTQHLLVADDADPGGDFPTEAAKILPLIPVTHTVTQAICSDVDGDSTACGNLEAVRAAMLTAWNRGALVVNWVGHGAFQQWEHGRLFHTDDIPTLATVPRYPLVLSISCFTSHFAHPDPGMTAMDEALVRSPKSGAIATFGNSGLGLGSSQTPLHLAFYQSALGANPVPLGVAANVSRAAVSSGWSDHLADSYHLFGDPALLLDLAARPWSSTLYLPIAMRSR